MMVGAPISPHSKTQESRSLRGRSRRYLPRFRTKNGIRGFVARFFDQWSRLWSVSEAALHFRAERVFNKTRTVWRRLTREPARHRSGDTNVLRADHPNFDQDWPRCRGWWVIRQSNPESNSKET